MTQNPKDNTKVVVQDLSYLSCDEVFQLCSFSSGRCLFLSASQLCLNVFFLFPNLKEQQKSGRSPFTVS